MSFLDLQNGIPTLRRTDLPIGSPEGLVLSRPSGSTINISPGRAVLVGATDRHVAVLGNPISKALTSSWSFGGSGGRFSGTVGNNQTWHVFLIRRDSDGAIDAGFDTSATAANRPSGWSARMIGSILTDGSGNIRDFVQSGDRFEWAASVNDLSTTDLTTSTSNQQAVLIPNGVRIVAIVGVRVTSTAGGFVMVASPLTLNSQVRAVQFPGAANIRSVFDIPTENGAIGLYASVSGLNVLVQTAGFIHPRGA